MIFAGYVHSQVCGATKDLTAKTTLFDSFHVTSPGMLSPSQLAAPTSGVHDHTSSSPSQFRSSRARPGA